MNIAEFLTRRLDEDEAVAQAAADRKLPDPYHLDDRIEAHIYRFDAARVLADIASKRELLAALERNVDHWSSDDHTRAAAETALEAAQGHVAAPYAEHPDYNPNWRIDA